MSLPADLLSNLIAAFSTALESPEPQIRGKAAKFLGKLGDIRAVQPLLDAMQREKDQNVYLSIMQAIDLIVNGKPDNMSNPANQPTFNIQQVGTINTGDVKIQGDQVGIQYNLANDTQLTEALEEFEAILKKLEQKHPEAAEAEAITIIEAEFHEIRQNKPWQWQNLLNLKRLWNGSKTAAIRVGEHFSEASLWGKAFVGFLEGVSEDVE